MTVFINVIHTVYMQSCCFVDKTRVVCFHDDHAESQFKGCTYLGDNICTNPESHIIPEKQCVNLADIFNQSNVEGWELNLQPLYLH